MRQKLMRVLFMCGALYMIPCILTMLIRKNIPETDGKTFDSGILVYISQGSEMEAMDLEEYLVGVVSAQIPADYPLEACKAQAVIARTHVMNIMGSRTSAAASELGQAYDSRETILEKYGTKASGYYETLVQAVTATSEEVLTFDGALAETVYFYGGTGKTRNAADVWGSEIPYLSAVESPEDGEAQENQTQVTMDVEECIQRLKAGDSDFEASAQTFKDTVQILEKDESGYVLSIQLGNKTFSGEQLRSLLDLPSAAFEVRAKRKTITFDVTGCGHGVGLSQQGALIMAEEGRNYEEILTWYFPGAGIE